MSRNLPARPNLEYLKKEAKDRLDDLRRADPRAQLADAQHDLAKEYGFASWPKLKAQVESVSADGRTLTIADDSGDSVIVLDRLMV